MSVMNKNYKINPKGHAMIKILVVLAVIAVLSVSGVYGYGVAIKKHKANKLISAIMQEAVFISAQLITGKTSPNLSSFNNSLFESVSTVSGTDNFKIALKTVDSDVCKQMKFMLRHSSIVHKINNNCTEMTFHKNYDPKSSMSDKYGL